MAENSLSLSKLPHRENRPIGHQLFPVNADIAVISMAIIWLCYLLFTGIFIYLLNPPFPFVVLGQYGVMTVISVFATWLLYRLLLVTAGGEITSSVVMLTLPTMLIALMVSYAGFSVINYEASTLGFSYFLDDTSLHQSFWPRLLAASFTHYLILASWGGVYLAFAHHRATLQAIENSRQLERDTRESELRALRYQLNPHFIFNALNSVSSLVIDGRNNEAEQLVEGLADYMRIVLKDDGESMVRVEDEIAQQVRYLKIEQVRFPGRLHFTVNVDPVVQDWKIPTLIIQPLIENAIKHGVARSVDPVSIEINAARDGNRLKLSVANNGRMHDGQASGTGLSNIRGRLMVIYGHAAALMTGNSPDGMAMASIIVPDDAFAMRDI